MKAKNTQEKGEHFSQAQILGSLHPTKLPIQDKIQVFISSSVKPSYVTAINTNYITDVLVQ